MDHITIVNVNKHTAVQTRLHGKSPSYVPNLFKQYCCHSYNNLSSFAIFFHYFYVIIFILSNFRSFASETGETKIDDSFTRYPQLVLVS